MAAKTLNRELTDRLFKCTADADVKALVESGADLATASRMALNEVLARVYNKKCSGTKDLAVEMLIGCTKGIDIPDVAATPIPAKIPSAAPANLTPEERTAFIKETLDSFTLKTGSNYMDQIQKKCKPLREIVATEDELRAAALTSDKVVLGKNSKVDKEFIMKRDPSWIQGCKTNGVDTLDFGAFPDPTL